MKKAILQILIYCIQLNITAQNFEWSRTGGQGYGDGKAIANDVHDNVYVTGHYSDTIFLSKYNSNGDLLWQKGPSEGGHAVAVDSSGIYVGAEYHIAKYDSAGTLLWSHKNTGLIDLCASPDKGFAVLGYLIDSAIIQDFTGTTVLHAKPNRVSIYLAKFNSAGNLVWVKQESAYCNYPCGKDAMYPVNELRGKHVATDNDNNIFITGVFSGTVTFDSTNNPVTIQTSGVDNIYLAKYKPDGALQWVKESSGGSYANPGNIKCMNDNSVYLIGTFPTQIAFQNIVLNCNMNDMFIAKFDALGNIIWGKRGGTWIGGGTSLAITKQGNLFAGGSFKHAMNFNGNTNTLYSSNGDGFILKLDSNADLIWATKTNNLGSYGGVDVEGLISDNTEHCYVTGDFSGSVVFDSSYYRSGPDMYVAKIGNTPAAGMSQSLNSSSLLIYPNPSNGSFNIFYTNTDAKPTILTIRDVMGQLILVKEYKTGGHEIVDIIDLSKHAKGIYFVEIIADRKRTVRKVVVY